jgi:hypothetical protein
MAGRPGFRATGPDRNVATVTCVRCGRQARPEHLNIDGPLPVCRDRARAACDARATARDAALPPIFDANGNRIATGDRVLDLDERAPVGTVTQLIDTDEGHHPLVVVLYDDGTEETWHTDPDGPDYHFYTCDEVAVQL